MNEHAITAQQILYDHVLILLIRLETVRRLQEVTYADLAEREYGYATGSRRLIGPKKRQNTKRNRIFGGQISASIFGVFGCFFLRPSVRHSGTALRLSLELYMFCITLHFV